VPAPRRRRWSCGLLLCSVVLAACTSPGEEGGAPTTTTTTTAAAVRCPDGSEVPDAAPTSAAVELDATPAGPEPRDGALDIGTLLPRSGDLAFLGAAALAGVELAVADLTDAGGVLGAAVGLRHGDSAEGSPGVAEGEAERLLGAGVDVLIGPLASGTTARVLPLVAGADAVLVSPASASSGLDALDRDGRLFRTGPDEALQGFALADLLVADGLRTISIAARADEYGSVIAGALTERFAASGGEVRSRVDYDPAADAIGPDVVDELDITADGIVLVGLAETALVVDALVSDGHGPGERGVYGTDGNLGERLGDLVQDRAELACMRGLLPITQPDDAFAERVRSHDPVLADLEGAGLDLAAEAYDAVVLAALAAETAGSDSGAAIGAGMGPVSADGTHCADAATCLEVLGAGDDLAYVGQSGPAALDEDGNRSAAGFTIVAFDGDGHLARLGTLQARR